MNDGGLPIERSGLCSMSGLQILYTHSVNGVHRSQNKGDFEPVVVTLGKLHQKEGEVLHGVGGQAKNVRAFALTLLS